MSVADSTCKLGRSVGDGAGSCWDRVLLCFPTVHPLPFRFCASLSRSHSPGGWPCTAAVYLFPLTSFLPPHCFRENENVFCFSFPFSLTPPPSPVLCPLFLLCIRRCVFCAPIVTCLVLPSRAVIRVLRVRSSNSARLVSLVLPPPPMSSPPAPHARSFRLFRLLHELEDGACAALPAAGAGGAEDGRCGASGRGWRATSARDGSIQKMKSGTFSLSFH